MKWVKAYQSQQKGAAKATQKKELAVSPLPAGAEPPASATDIRATLVKDMHYYMANVKAAAAERAPKLEKTKEELNRRSAVTIQRVIRGVRNPLLPPSGVNLTPIFPLYIASILFIAYLSIA